MVNIPSVSDLDITGKKVLVRGDFDAADGQNIRADSIREIVKYLHHRGADKIKVIGHTQTSYDLAGQLKTEFPEVEFDASLRANSGEITNNLEFAQQLAEGWNAYVNEAFAVSHRMHASVVALPQVFLSRQPNSAVAGLRFVAEVSNLSKMLVNPKRPVVAAISGVKEDKLKYLPAFTRICDKVLVGGRLPDYIEKNPTFEFRDPKFILAQLIPDRQDITMRSIETFEAEIVKAGTIVLAGPVGKFEDAGHRQGTQRVFEAITHNQTAFKIAGGGDTAAAISLLKLTESFDWISVGGGAMLEFLAKGTLPGINALSEN